MLKRGGNAIYGDVFFASAAGFLGDGFTFWMNCFNFLIYWVCGSNTRLVILANAERGMSSI